MHFTTQTCEHRQLHGHGHGHRRTDHTHYFNRHNTHIHIHKHKNKKHLSNIWTPSKTIESKLTSLFWNIFLEAFPDFWSSITKSAINEPADKIYQNINKLKDIRHTHAQTLKLTQALACYQHTNIHTHDTPIQTIVHTTKVHDNTYSQTDNHAHTYTHNTHTQQTRT